VTSDAPNENPVTMANGFRSSAELNPRARAALNSKRNEAFRSTPIERNSLSRSECGPEERKRRCIEVHEVETRYRDCVVDAVNADVSVDVSLGRDAKVRGAA
jgi:hypothetical protein